MLNLTQPESLLDALFTWLNDNLPRDPKKLLTPEDVAHLSLTPEEFAWLPCETHVCPWRRVRYKYVNGIEIWCRHMTLPALTEVSDLRGRLAWKLNGNTQALFRRREGQQQPHPADQLMSGAQ